MKVKRIEHVGVVLRPGHAGCRIAFIDPSATENCLIELAQLPAGGL
jgi:methylmalonyl-CoA/ethylmalonyl-CoA epimerase